MSHDPKSEAGPGAGVLEPFGAAGHPVHSRILTVDVRRKDVGHVRADANIIDVRKCGFVPTGGDLQTAGIIHNMSIDAVVALEGREVTRFEPSQAVVAFEAAEATGGESCRDPIGRLRGMVGQRLGSGSPRVLTGLFGGALGCSHLLTLAQLVLATIPRALDHEAERIGEGLGEREDGERIFKRALMVDGLERIEASQMQMALQMLELHTTPRSRCLTDPFRRLGRQHEVRVLADVSTRNMSIETVRSSVREREYDDMHGASWRSVDPLLEPLIGTSAMGGLGRRLLDLLGDEPDQRPLLDTMLNLAPGMIQCLAGVAHRFTERAEALAEARASDRPSVFNLGGQPNSCYVWREGSPMSLRRAGMPDREHGEEPS